MTLFLLGFLTNALCSCGALYVLFRSASRTSAICRALQAFHAPAEHVVRHAPPALPQEAPTASALPPNAYEDCVGALMGMGAKKAQAQGLVNGAMQALVQNGVNVNAETLLKEACKRKGLVQ